MDDYAANDYKPFGPRKEHFCITCKRYYKMLFEKGITESEFTPICKGDVRDAFPDRDDLEGDEKDEYELAQIFNDPIAWLGAISGWESRWYQSEMARCTSQFKVVRAGRRVGKTCIIAGIAIHFTQTNAQKISLLITPYQAQITKIFDEIKKFIISSPILQSSIVKNISSPPMMIQWENGSVIRGFSSGVKSGVRSDQVRGQDAHYIFLDEMDFQGDYEIETILAIMLTSPDVKVWASSTPKGWRKKFYTWINQKDIGFKEFHYISAESPSVTPSVMKMIEASTSPLGLVHEYLAEFGEEAYGVFGPEHVDATLYRYDYKGLQPTKGCPRIMGVDWNAHAGVHIVILEYCESQDLYTGSKYKMVHKTIVPKQEFTQTAAVEKIVSLDAHWNCDWIYLDSGFGSTQYEILKRTGIANPKTRLHEKTVEVVIGSHRKIRDPLSGEEINKGTKQFMVELAARQVEDFRVCLPRAEDTQVIIEPDVPDAPNLGIVQQMRGFVVVRSTQSGQPIYSQDYEHTLTAWMLAILGMVEKFSDLNRVDFTTAVGSMKDQGANTAGRTVHRDIVTGEAVTKEFTNQARPGTSRTSYSTGIVRMSGYHSVANHMSDRKKLPTKSQGGRSNISRNPKGRSSF